MGLVDRLRCPRCATSPLVEGPARLSCPSCGWARTWDGHILSVLDQDPSASFDHLHDVLHEHNHHPVTWELFYRRQCELIESALKPGSLVLDIGCGPAAVYEVPAEVELVGVDPSLPSLAAHEQLALGLHTTGAQVPLEDDTADVVIANYSLHHMIGRSVPEARANVEATLQEIGRVARPGAEVLVLEVCPWAPTWVAERLGWRAAKRILGDAVDFVFWPARALEAMGRVAFPGATLEQHRYGVGPLATFPPVIGQPGLRVPRAAYPFSVRLFHWQLAVA
jgi:SAM-dependent methyltransferase